MYYVRSRYKMLTKKKKKKRSRPVTLGREVLAGVVLFPRPAVWYFSIGWRGVVSTLVCLFLRLVVLHCLAGTVTWRLGASVVLVGGPGVMWLWLCCCVVVLGQSVWAVMTWEAVAYLWGLWWLVVRLWGCRGCTLWVSPLAFCSPVGILHASHPLQEGEEAVLAAVHMGVSFGAFWAC
jgi:hypothetical protein